jgi:hypothetical protein
VSIRSCLIVVVWWLVESTAAANRIEFSCGVGPSKRPSIRLASHRHTATIATDQPATIAPTNQLAASTSPPHNTSRVLRHQQLRARRPPLFASHLAMSHPPLLASARPAAESSGVQKQSNPPQPPPSTMPSSNAQPRVSPAAAADTWSPEEDALRTHRWQPVPHMSAPGLRYIQQRQEISRRRSIDDIRHRLHHLGDEMKQAKAVNVHELTRQLVDLQSQRQTAELRLSSLQATIQQLQTESIAL